jgi:ribosomal protein L37AE/L43A
LGEAGLKMNKPKPEKKLCHLCAKMKVVVTKKRFAAPIDLCRICIADFQRSAFLLPMEKPEKKNEKGDNKQ